MSETKEVTCDEYLRIRAAQKSNERVTGKMVMAAIEQAQKEGVIEGLAVPTEIYERNTYTWHRILTAALDAQDSGE